MSSALESPTPSLTKESAAASGHLASDPPALRNTFRILGVFCVYLLLLELAADIFRLPQPTTALLRFIPYCLSLAALAYSGRPLLKLDKQTIFMVLFLGCLFVVFLLDVTRNVQLLSGMPLLGANGLFRREIRDLAEILAICCFLIGSYLMILETSRARILLSQEVEKLQRAEATLERSERRYRLISENTGDVIWTLNLASRRFTFVSPSVQRLRGYTPEEAIAQTVEETMTPESHQFFEATLAQRQAAVEGGDESARSWTGQIDQRRKDGSIVPTEVVITPLSDEEGRVVEILGVTRDITKRRQVEDDLKRSNSLLRATFESTADGILVVDFEGKWVDWNSQYVQLWRVPAELLAARSDQKGLEYGLSQIEQPDQFLIKIRQLYAHPEAESFDMVHFKDGRVVERYSQPQRLEGRPIGRVWSFRDVTERRRLEEQLRHAQKMEAVGQLAGGIAHDFNNLLTVIQGHCSLLQTEQQAADHQIESLKEIEAAARRAANLTRQLLMFSRRQIMQMKPLDLNSVIGHLLKMLGRLLGEHIVLEFQGAEALPFIAADEGMMEQVVMNLSVNARDAMPKGGRLTLHTRLVEIDAQSAEVNPEARAGRFVCLTVSDTGCGMDLATRKRVFEPFFTTKDIGKGTGLGLATVYGIVKQHQGWTEVESEVGQGTTFRIFLPVSAASAPVSSVVVPKAELRGGTETILLVEDEPAVRQLAKYSLNCSGYQVLEATNAVEAKDVWREHRGRIALLLTDMVMPEGVTGMELAEQLRSEKGTLKVIISSGYSLEMSQSEAPTISGITYLAKPYRMPALAMTVRKCLDEA